MKRNASSRAFIILLCCFLIVTLFSGCSKKPKSEESNSSNSMTDSSLAGSESSFDSSDSDSMVTTTNAVDGTTNKITGSTSKTQNTTTKTSTPAQTDTKTYDAFFNTLIQGKLTSNASVSVVNSSSKVLYKYNKVTENFGKGTTAKESTKYELGSLTMPVISALVLTLQDSGKINVDKPIKNYLTDIQLNNVTIKQVMMHLSGIGENSTCEYCRNQTEYNALVAKVKGIGATGAAGQKFSFNVYNYTLLKLLIEKASGKSIEVYAKEKLFTPLGMTNSTFVSSTLSSGSYMKRYDDKNKTWIDGKGNIATGDQGLFSTSSDMGKFCAMLLSSDVKVLSRKSKDLLLKEQTNGAFDSTLGFWVKGTKNSLQLFGFYNNTDTIAHSGDSGSLMALDLKTGTALVFLTNNSSIFSDWVIYGKIMDEYAMMVDAQLAQRLKPLTYEIEHADKKPTIDGIINDTEWAKSKKYSLSYKQNITNGRGCSFWDIIVGKDSQPPYRVSANFNFLWDANNLYISCKVTDPKVVCVDRIGKALNNQDTVQFAFDPMLHKKDTQEDSYIFDFSPLSGIESNGPATWYEHWQYNAMDNSKGVVVKGARSSVGYNMEMVIPWSALRNLKENFKVQSGLTMGFGLLIVDHDTVGNRQDLLTDFGNGDNTILDASTYNTLKLQ